MDSWQEHCPIDEREAPVKRQAWKGGWIYRIEHGPGKPDRKTILSMVDRPSLASVWLQGFSSANTHAETE